MSFDTKTELVGENLYPYRHLVLHQTYLAAENKIGSRCTIGSGVLA